MGPAVSVWVGGRVCGWEGGWGGEGKGSSHPHSLGYAGHLGKGSRGHPDLPPLIVARLPLGHDAAKPNSPQQALWGGPCRVTGSGSKDAAPGKRIRKPHNGRSVSLITDPCQLPPPRKPRPPRGYPIPKSQHGLPPPAVTAHSSEDGSVETSVVHVVLPAACGCHQLGPLDYHKVTKQPMDMATVYYREP